MLYAEITALCNKDGNCWATNKYFAELYEVGKTTISTAISELVEYGYIATSEVDNRRQITLLPLSKNLNPPFKNLKGVFQKSERGISKNCNTPLSKNCKHNNTSINTINNNNIDIYNSENFQKEISDVERWTEDVKTNNDHIFSVMLANEILYLDPAAEKKLPEIYTAHEAKCIRENYEFKSQQHFRKSLIQYIKSYLNNDRTKTNSGASKGTKPNSSAIIEHRTDF
jgi:hypothetical protein